MVMKYSIVLLFSLIATAANSETLFPSSVVSNDIDFIRVNDRSEKSNIKFFGVERKEMPDRRTDELLDNVFYISHKYLGLLILYFFIQR